MQKRPIDRIRDAAFSLRLGTGQDGNFVDFYKIGEERMLWVRSTDIYEVKLADQIDPQRTNAALPHAQQKVLDVGADDTFVQRILLTAKALFWDNTFGKEFNRTRALELAFEMLRDAVNMRGMLSDLQSVQATEAACFDSMDQDKASVQLPSIPDISARFDAFTVKANHIAKSLRELATLFYGVRLTKKWVEALERIVIEDQGASSAFADFMKRSAPFLLFTINARNACEHPDEAMRLVVLDYTLNEKGDVVAPTVEVIHATTPNPRMDAVAFMQAMTESMVTLAEWLMAHLCAANVRPFGVMQIVLSEIPEGNRQNGVRFGYLGDLNGRLVPFA